MGTNFYIRNRKFSDEQKAEIIQLIENDNIEEARMKLYDVNLIHIGKRSKGWKFLFNANNFQYFKPTKESLINFLKEKEIVDEYGYMYSFEEFWNEEIPTGDNLYDLEEYYKNNNDLYPYKCPIDIIKQFKEQYNIDVNSVGEFYIDDLRFTTSIEFS